MRPIVFLVPLVALAACTAQPPPIAKTAPVFPTFDHWAPQEVATNVQDWDRVATKVADLLAANGLLRGPSTTLMVTSVEGSVIGAPPREFGGQRVNGHMISVTYDHNFAASQQVGDSLWNEIINRGPTRDMKVDLRVNLVAWQSRVGTQPNVLRREGVWQATVRVGDQIVASFREPFYFMDSDAGLYVQVAAPPLSPSEALAASARPLTYSTN